MQEIKEEPFQEQSLINKDATKIVEPIKKDICEEIHLSSLTSDLNKLSINSESFNSPKKEITINKEDISEKEYINFPKKNLNLSSLISNDINMNNSQIKTPLKQDSAPFNFKQKGKVNFQEKTIVGTASGNEYNYHRNSISMRSPIYSYFDESQKYLSEQYGEENLINLTGKRNKKKMSSNNEIPKEPQNSSNSESKNLVKPKLKKSNSSLNKDTKEEHEVETPNYNEFNLFNDNNISPEYYNMSQHSSGLNNIYANKFSRKLSQATGSYIEGNSNNKFGNVGSFGENDINDVNINIPYNENNISNDDYLNNFNIYQQ